MTRSRYRIVETDRPYFLTCTIVGWLPIFTRPEAVEIIYDSWRYLQRERQAVLLGYVILENHLHFIASAELPDVMQSFKPFTAKQLLALLKQRGAQTLLRGLQSLKLEHKGASDYQVWQEGSHPEQIQNEEIMRQKLEYVHNNPVMRGYVDDPLHWRNSSARNYARQVGLIDVCTDWG